MICIWDLTFHMTTRFLRVIIRLLLPPCRIEFVGNILVGHVQGLFQIRESLFSLNPTIILQGVPNDLTCFLDGPLLIIKHKIILLALDNPWKTTPQEEPIAIEPFKYLAQRLIKEALHHRKWFLRAEIPSFGKELPHDVGGIPPPLLSERTIVESMFHLFNWLWAAVRAIFVNLCQDISTPLVMSHSQCLVLHHLGWNIATSR